MLSILPAQRSVSDTDDADIDNGSRARSGTGRIGELSACGRWTGMWRSLVAHLTGGQGVYPALVGPNNWKSMPRAVAQLGSAPDWGSGGRRFKSCQPDVKAQVRVGFSPGLLHARGRFPWSPSGPPGALAGGRLWTNGPPRTRFLWIRGPKGDQNASGSTPAGVGAHHRLRDAGPLRRACLRCPAAERKALACSAADAR